MTATAMAERKATETAAAAQPARTGRTGRKERSIKQRTVDAAKRYLVARGYNVRSTWESESQFGFVAQWRSFVGSQTASARTSCQTSRP